MDATGTAHAAGAAVDGSGHGARTPRRRGGGGVRRATAIAMLGLTVVLAGACSKAADTSSSAGQPSSDARKGAGGGSSAAPAAPTGEAASLNTNAVDQPASEQGRSVISSASLTVKVADVGSAKDRAAGAAEKAGGFLFAEQTTFGERSQATMTLKVPPPAFRGVIDELGHLGTLASEEVKSDDVTQQVIDLQARITATEASLGRTRDLLGGAKNLTEMSQLENEVVRRQADLESLRGQQKTLQAKVDMATVVLTLTGDADATPAVQQQREEAERKRNEAAPLPGFFDGLNGGLRVAASAGSVGLAVVGALVPFLPLVIIGVVAVRLTKRARRRRVAPEVGGAPPASAPAG